MSALPLSGSASSRSLIGITITPTTIRITITVTAGTLVTMATQRPPMVFCPVVAALASLVVRDVGFGRRCSPKMPMSAGSRVRAAATATATPLAAANPMTLRKGIWATASPQRAMITVVPAKTTADPAVARACAIDSGTLMPYASWRRCRVTMNSP